MVFGGAGGEHSGRLRDEIIDTARDQFLDFVWISLMAPLSKNIAKGTTDPRVELCLPK